MRKEKVHCPSQTDRGGSAEAGCTLEGLRDCGFINGHKDPTFTVATRHHGGKIGRLGSGLFDDHI